jgi:hypothetical protein
VLSLISETF